jgi:uncharacterized protein DUF982
MQVNLKCGPACAGSDEEIADEKIETKRCRLPGKRKPCITLSRSSGEDAIDFLHHRWPKKKNRKFNTAEKACAGALRQADRKGCAGSAFVSAAKEANL